MISGQGKFIWSDERMYEGEWLENKMHGYGTYTWPDGRMYVGDYLNGAQHGQGVLTYPDGKKRTGTWEHGRLTELTDDEATPTGTSSALAKMLRGNVGGLLSN
jgi:hypothetical protein